MLTPPAPVGAGAGGVVATAAGADDGGGVVLAAAPGWPAPWPWPREEIRKIPSPARITTTTAKSAFCWPGESSMAPPLLPAPDRAEPERLRPLGGGARAFRPSPAGRPGTGRPGTGRAGRAGGAAATVVPARGRRPGTVAGAVAWRVGGAHSSGPAAGRPDRAGLPAGTGRGTGQPAAGRVVTAAAGGGPAGAAAEGGRSGGRRGRGRADRGGPGRSGLAHGAAAGSAGSAGARPPGRTAGAGPGRSCGRCRCRRRARGPG